MGEHNSEVIESYAAYTQALKDIGYIDEGALEKLHEGLDDLQDTDLVALDGILSERLNSVVGPVTLQTLLSIDGVGEDQVEHVLNLGAEHDVTFARALEAETAAIQENARKTQHTVGEIKEIRQGLSDGP